MSNHTRRRRQRRLLTCEPLEPRRLLAADALYRVNAGGPAIGEDWEADTAAQPSQYHNAQLADNKTYSTSAAIDLSQATVPPGTPESLFQSERWDPASGDELTWSFPVSPGSYEVRLYFAEIYEGTQMPAARLFDVVIEGNTVLDDYDVFTEVGANTAVVKTLDVTADNSLNISFLHVEENPAIKAIEILESRIPNQLRASTPVVDLGSHFLGDSSTATVAIRNAGADGDPVITFNPSDVMITGSHANEFSVEFSQTDPLQLAPGAAVSLSVHWTALDLGVRQARLTIPSSAENSPLTLDIQAAAITSQAAALVMIATGGDLDSSSSVNAGSFQILNESQGGEKIEWVRFDLSTSLLPDVVFDPNSKAGDPTGHGFSAASGSAATGHSGHTFGGPHDGGFDYIDLEFTDFAPSESFAWDGDTDPTSIRGAVTPGPEHAGSVSGLEMIGATITVRFDDGVELTGRTYRVPDSQTGSQVYLGQSAPSSAVRLSLEDVPTTPTRLTDSQQLVQIEGPAGATVALLTAEGALLVDGVPNGGFDLDLFEANKILSFDEQFVILDSFGSSTVPVELRRSRDEAGINYLVATLVDANGRTGPTSEITVEFDPEDTNQPPQLEELPETLVDAGSTTIIDVTAVDPEAGSLTYVAGNLPGFASFEDQADGTATITVSPTSVDVGSYEIPVTVMDNGTPSLSDTQNLMLTVVPANRSAVIYRVNAGGPSIDSDPDWESDEGAPGSQDHSNSAHSQTYTKSAAIDIGHPSLPPGTPEAIFQSERWDPADGEEMQWAYAVTPGQYEVRLYFAEIYDGAQFDGARQFDVTIEGQKVLQGFDVHADVGPNRGVMKSFLVSSDEHLNIEFGHVTENPAVKAIEIISAGSSLASSVSLVDFGDVLIGNTLQRSFEIVNSGVPGDPVISIDPAAVKTGELSAQGFEVTFPSLTLIDLAPQESANILVSFTATDATPRAAELSIPHSGDDPSIKIGLTATGVAEVPIGFGKSSLTGADVSRPTSLQFGPDNRLYVAEQDGLLKIFEISRSGANDYQVSLSESISSIQTIANHDDLGNLDPSQDTRLVTGILVVGTSDNPVIYVASSDPRIGGGEASADLNLDTNSGILSRLTWDGSSWNKLDLVRGLPRSEENHASNGIQIDESTNTLYLAQGGHTNMGATSRNFAYQPEYALSAAILTIDLDAIGETTYDLPTLNDEDHPGADANDPFGGNDGKNQARLVAGGPVQVYAPGFRNPYDVLLTTNGRLYSIDNGPNAGWGDQPINEGSAGLATNGPNEPGQTYGDGLHFISDEGYYAGHPNPTRSNPQNTFNASDPQSPVSVGNPVESDYRQPGSENGALVVFPASTNGLVEYTAGNFQGSLRGDLLAASFDNSIKRIKLDNSGEAALLSENLFNNVGVVPLDVTAQSNTGVFPGTIWAADIVTGDIIVFEPDDYDGQIVGTGTVGDADDDGYKDDDEIAVGTDPNNAADVPSDHDMDFLPDLLDPDDDNDGWLDSQDPFAIDPNNGTTTKIGFTHLWENDSNSPGGLLNLGFTGLMTNGETDYAQLYDETALTAGGAAGVLTLDEITEGDATGSLNTQEQAFQLGVDVAGVTDSFFAHTRVLAPFAGIVPAGNQSMGLQIGSGDQDNYFKIVITANDGGTGVEWQKEVDGQVTVGDFSGLTLPGVGAVDLYLRVDPNAKTVQPLYQVTIDGNTDDAIALTGPTPIPASWLSGTHGLAVGIISTSVGAAPSISVTWDLISVEFDNPQPDPPSAPPSEVAFRVNAGGPEIPADFAWDMDTASSASTYHNGPSAQSATYITTGDIDLGHPSIPPGTPQALFQSERWDAASGDEMQWDFPVTAGQYEVRLYFAEIYGGAQAVGSRVFDVLIEGQLRLDDYDVFGEVGANTGVLKSFVVDSDSNLDIDLHHVTENPAIKGIEILTTAAAGDNHAPVLQPLQDLAMTEGEQIQVTLTATDSDGDSITLSGMDLPEFASLQDHGGGTGTLTLAPQVGDAAVSSITVRATDDATHPLTSDQSFSLLVNALGGHSVVFRINAGGPTLETNPEWQSDTVQGSAIDAPRVIDVANRLELFVDDFLIDSMVGAGLELHPPTLAAETAGQHASGAYPSVLYDGAQYHHYYRGTLSGVDPFSGVDGTNSEVYRYEVSSDGLNWTQPELNLVNVHVDGPNNVILANDAPSMHNFMPFLDTRPGVGPQHRYKAIAGLSHTNSGPTPISGLRAYSSPDGLNWTLLSPDPVITLDDLPENHDTYAFDSANVAFWSQLENQYVIYYRTWSEGVPGPSNSLRSISRAVSDDFVNWTNHVDIDVNEPGEHLYSAAINPYFRAPHIYTGLPTQFLSGNSASNTRILFMTSRDGVNFDRHSGQQVFINGVSGNRKNYAVPRIAQTGSNELSYYIQSGQRYTQRLDGFSSVDTTGSQGEFVTHPLSFFGSRLQLNYVTAATGQIRVELQDTAGQPLPGFGLNASDALQGDNVEGVASWNGSSDLSQLAGQTVRLRFVMQDADLYAMQFVADANLQLPARLGVPRGLSAMAGDILSIPVQLTVAGSTMVNAVQVALKIDPQQFSIESVETGSALNGMTPSFEVDASTGTVAASASGPSVQLGPGTMDVFNIIVRVVDHPRLGLAQLNLLDELSGLRTSLNDGALLLAPAPSDEADDATDGTASINGAYFNVAAADSQTATVTNSINLSHPSLPADTPVSLFQTERWDTSDGEELKWTFPVSAGPHEVRLYFAETFVGAQKAGARLFDVLVEGKQVLDNYDVYADVGGFTGVVKSFVVQSDQHLDIEFKHVTENPAIKAIEVLAVAQNSGAESEASREYFEPRPSVRGDVNGDGLVTPRDALVVINALNAPSRGSESWEGSFQSLDVNGDHIVSPRDVLAIINHIQGTPSEGERSPPTGNAEPLSAGIARLGSISAADYWTVATWRWVSSTSEVDRTLPSNDLEDDRRDIDEAERQQLFASGDAWWT